TQKSEQGPLHGFPLSNRGSVAVAGAANWRVSTCSSPAFTLTFRLTGAPNDGFDNVISYVPGARSTDAGVTTVSLNATVEPVATLRMLDTSPQGKAFNATRPCIAGVAATTDAAGVDCAGFASGNHLLRVTIATTTSATKVT